MTEAEARDIVEKYQALLAWVVSARPWLSRADPTGLKLIKGGLELEWFTAEISDGHLGSGKVPWLMRGRDEVIPSDIHQMDLCQLLAQQDKSYHQATS